MAYCSSSLIFKIHVDMGELNQRDHQCSGEILHL